jgi:SAM-dependent methyltransferase
MPTNRDESRRVAAELVQAHRERGDLLGWFEALYARANGDPNGIPWADLAPAPGWVAWTKREKPQGNGKKAVVIGCGLGDDAEQLAKLGFAVTAFDISETAVGWCHRRFPNSRVRYEVANLLALPETWRSAFDFVLEIYTVQALAVQLRQQAIASAATLVAPKGQLLAIGRLSDTPADPAQLPPVPLTRADLQHFQQAGLTEARFEEYVDNDVRRFRVEYQR